ncbi:MAG TPA: hypothetical protein VK100_08625 [Pseudogracilibacillus sp.]|nr:hypothetical protein [Pseudogracilibacillus sp.]
MPWNQQNYPSSFNNLTSDVRKKAIEIANALIQEDYSEERAIAIAISKAREAIQDDDQRPLYIVKKRDDDWIFMKEHGQKAIYVESVKEDVLQKAKPYVNEQNGRLKIYREDGTIEQTLYE